MAMAGRRLYPHTPDYAVPPGETLRETIEALGMDQTDLAVRTGLDKKTINQIVNGKHPLTQHTAIRLERATGVPARLWNNLEMQYQERLARQRDREHLESELTWLSSIPVRQLSTRGVVQASGDRIELMRQALGFFGVGSTTEWRQWLDGVLRRMGMPLPDRFQEGATATWIRLGEVAAREISSRPFDSESFRRGLSEVRRMNHATTSGTEHRIVELCAEAGVAVVFVPQIPGCPALSLTRWLTPCKALIQIPFHSRPDDRLRAVLFHAAGHILCDPKKTITIDTGEGDKESERKANRFASEWLAPFGNVVRPASPRPTLRSPRASGLDSRATKRNATP
jgi:addiction module HigA family antidote